MFPRLLLALTLTAVAAATAPAIELPGFAPGPAKATLDGPRLAMENAVLQARWDLSPGSRRLVEVIDRVADARLVCDSRLFSVKLADGSELASAALCPAGQATLERITPRPTATRLAERSAGWRAALELATADGRTRFRWQAVLRDGSNYVHQEVALLAHAGPHAGLRPVEFGLLDLPAGDARSCGAVVGSPLVSGIRTRRGPLFPFNSLKFQSVMCARLSLAAELGADLRDLTDDIRMAAASDTQLQEFFVTPAMMTAEAWDVAAEAIGWVQRNADVLADSRGIGGDPSKGEVYGFASWTPRMGIVALRNPTGQAVPFAVDVEQAFDLPATAARRYVLRTPWKQRGPASERRAEAGRPVEFWLSPWEVLVLEAQPMH